MLKDLELNSVSKSLCYLKTNHLMAIHYYFYFAHYEYYDSSSCFQQFTLHAAQSSTLAGTNRINSFPFRGTH